MRLGPFDGGEDGDHDGVGFVEITKTYATQSKFPIKKGLIEYRNVGM